MRYLAIPLLTTATLLFATTTIAWAGSPTSPDVSSGTTTLTNAPERAMLTDTQMDKMKAGDLRDQQKQRSQANNIPFGQCKKGPGLSQCH